MAKRLKGVTAERQVNWYVNHLDSYENALRNYEPFWRTDDLRSTGIKVKIPHFKTPNRIVHLLSLNELWMYLHLARNPQVIEIYEQYAIPLEISLAAAEFLEVKHPVYVGTNVNAIQTIDFVVDMIDFETGEIFKKAIPIKQPKDAQKFRTAEKLAIQEASADMEEMQYQLITSEVLRTNCSVNLEILYRYRELPFVLNKVSRRFLNNFFGELFDARHERAADLIERSCSATGIDYNTGISIFYNALWHKRVEMDWTKLLRLEMAASDLGIQPND